MSDENPTAKYELKFADDEVVTIEIEFKFSDNAEGHIDIPTFVNLASNELLLSMAGPNFKEVEDE